MVNLFLRERNKDLRNRLYFHATARNDEKICHPEPGATHVAHCDNISDNFTHHPELDSSSNSLINNYTDFSRFTSLFSLKHAAFTLAEVLITLGIIGVVAAMTMPTLINNYQKKAAITAAKKAYSTLSQAYTQLVNDNGEGLSVCSINNSECLGKLFAPYLKSLNGNGKLYTPSSEKAEGCWEDNDIGMVNETHYCFSAVDGISYDFDMEFQEANKKQALIYVDINGLKRPNKFGKDRFAFIVLNSTLLPAKDFLGQDYYTSATTCDDGKADNNGKTAYPNSGCAYKYIYEE